MTGAEDLKQRFALARLRTTKSAQLDELVKLCKWRDAQTLGQELGLPVSINVVIDIRSRMAQHA